MEYYIKVKNNSGKDKSITTSDGLSYMLKDKDEKIIGIYNEDQVSNIIKLLKNGLEVSKVLKENIKDEWIIEQCSEITELPVKKDSVLDNKNNTKIQEIPKKKRGRPSKKK